MNEEKIKLLEEQIFYWENLIKTTEISNPIYTWIKDDKIEQKMKALKQILDLYQKEKEKNKENIEALEEWINGERISPVIENNYISKDKIKDKITYYENLIKVNPKDEEILRHIIYALQELLESEV